MPNPILATLTAEIAEDVTVMGSATILINGFAARMQTAVDAALANGATEAELAPIAAEIAALDAGANELATAVANNTPGA